MSRGMSIGDLISRHDNSKINIKIPLDIIKPQHLKLFMDLATRIAEESKAKKLQVGCVIVKNHNPISISWNGQPEGWDNNCEDEIDNKLVTKNSVLHAEENAIGKLAKDGISANNAIIFITHAPCINCARLIFRSGIAKVYYKNTYRSNDGLEFLTKCGIIAEKFPIDPITYIDIINDGNISVPTNFA